MTAGLIGGTIGPYRVLSELGRGGMATVYLAEDTTGGQVALKVLHAHLDQDKTIVSRFLREGRAAAALRHPNVVQVLDADEADGRQYIALQLVRGVGDVDRRSDIYSLGVAAYQMLTGQLPFRDQTPLVLLRRVVEDVPDPPDRLVASIPPGVNFAVMVALAKRPETRYRRAEEFAAALTKGLTVAPDPAEYAVLITVRSVPAAQPSAPEASGQTPGNVAKRPPLQAASSRRQNGVIAIAAIAAGLLMVALIVLFLRRSQAAEASKVASVPTAGSESSQLAATILPPTATPTETAAPTPTATKVQEPTALPTLIFEPDLPAAAQKSPQLFQWQPVPALIDDFSAGLGDWPVAARPTFVTAIWDGVFVVLIRKPFTLLSTPRGIAVGDLQVSISASLPRDQEGLHAGLFFRSSGPDDTYRLDYVPNEGIELSAIKKGQTNVLLQRRALPYIPDQYRVKLAVTAVGDQIQVAVNDKAVATVEDGTYDRGDLAFYGISKDSAETRFVFDDYEFAPAASEAVQLQLSPYDDKSRRFSLYVPESWIKSPTSHGMTFVAPNGLAYITAEQVPGVHAGEPLQDVARRYVETARQTFQNIKEETGETVQRGGFECYRESASADALGSTYSVELRAFNMDGRGFVVAAASTRSQQAVYRPLLEHILDNFRPDR